MLTLCYYEGLTCREAAEIMEMSVAAVEALWPRPVVLAEQENPLRSPTWRFSARWWAKPLPARRDRPFR